MSVYEEVTKTITNELEKDSPPWVYSWQAHLPQNFISKREYRGISVVLLWSRGFSSPYWLTSSQVRSLGGNIKKRSKATVLFHASRRYHVFNLEQTEGITIQKVEDKQPSVIFTEAQAFISALGSKVILGAPGAFYNIPEDEIHLPQPEKFNSMESYFAVSFHEHLHWSSHASRLKRHSLMHYGDEHAIEELVAELGAAFLCSHLQISPKLREDYTVYVGSWLWLLERDTQAVIKASALAAKACDYLRDKALKRDLKELV